ncbi:MAG: hypothetical protein ACOC33_03125 [bacterium]
MEKSNLIGISGEMQSGKDLTGFIINSIISGLDNDEVSLAITSKFFRKNVKYDFEIKKFAAIIKQVVSLITGYTLEDLEKQEIKNKLLGWERYVLYYGIEKKLVRVFETHEDAYDYMVEHEITENPSYKLSYDDMTLRDFMIYLGTEAGREIIHPDIWINGLFKDYKETSNWIITDVRFFNEANRIKNLNGLIIRVERNFESRTNTTHASEKQLNKNNFSWDYIIDNNDTIESLITKLREILVKENFI